MKRGKKVKSRNRRKTKKVEKRSKLQERYYDQFDFIESPLLVDLHVYHNTHEKRLRGVTYNEIDQIHIYLSSHENIPDILATINHELLHSAIGREFYNLEDENLYDHVEHIGLMWMSWANEIIHEKDDLVPQWFSNNQT